MNSISKIKLSESALIKVTTVIVIGHLNLEAGKKFLGNAQINLGLVRDLLTRNYDTEDMIKVINLKVQQWSHLPTMRPYLRPVTLFDAYNFKIYLREANGFFGTQAKRQ